MVLENSHKAWLQIAENSKGDDTAYSTNTISGNIIKTTRNNLYTTKILIMFLCFYVSICLSICLSIYMCMCVYVCVCVRECEQIRKTLHKSKCSIAGHQNSIQTKTNSNLTFLGNTVILNLLWIKKSLPKFFEMKLDNFYHLESLDYCIHPYDNIHNFSAVASFDLFQVILIELEDLLGTKVYRNDNTPILV